MTLHQLSFTFTYPFAVPGRTQRGPSWRVRRLARRHNIPVTLAEVYAVEMGLPVEGERR